MNSLSESYSNLDTLLTSSRSLVTSLLRSQKSDTWYLETAFYILIGTIIWLLFRRILYGPLWWLVWLPVELAFRSTFAVLGIVGVTGGAQKSVVSIEHAVSSGLPTTSMAAVIPSASIPPVAGFSSEEKVSTPSSEPDTENMSEQIARMIDDREEEERQHLSDEATNVDDISPEERKRQEEMPRNPKKRMWEEGVDNPTNKDEL